MEQIISKRFFLVGRLKDQRKFTGNIWCRPLLQ